MGDVNIYRTEKHSEKIGIICPPTDVRIMIEKTAYFVKKNGPSFEKRIMSQQFSNSKLNFLKPSEPYFAYYQEKLKEFREGSKASYEQSVEKNKEGEKHFISDRLCMISKDIPDIAILSESSEICSTNIFTVHIPHRLTQLELDVLKLSAQFTARTGKAFLSGLFQREQNNPLFAFIRPSNSLYPMFTNLVDIYQKILMPTQKIEDILTKNFENQEIVLTRCLKRLENVMAGDHEKNITNQRFDSSSLHDFTVVENIEFFDDEESSLPIPLTIRETLLLSKKKSQENLTTSNTDG